jgi:hypothetical protein
MKKLQMKIGTDKMLTKDQMKKITGGDCPYGGFSGVCYCNDQNVHVLDNVCNEDLFAYLENICVGVESVQCYRN